MFQSCLAKKLAFLALMSRTTRPPSFFGKQTCFQATRADLFLCKSLIHRKLQHKLIILLITKAGIRKMLIQNWTTACKTDLINSKRPAKERCLPIQLWIDNSNLGRIWDNWLASSLCGLSGTPRYLKEKLPSVNLEERRMVCFTSLVTPTKYIEDLDALITRLDVSQMQLSNEGEYYQNACHTGRARGCHQRKLGGWFQELDI